MLRSPPSRNDNAKINKIELKCSECNVIFNELLAFIANKVDTLPETGIIQICLSAYSFDEIEKARSVVYSSIAPHKKYLRKKEGAEQKCLLEIIKLVKECDPDCLPIFAVQNINKLPPVTFDHIDVTSFLKEMVILKNDISKLKHDNSQLECNNSKEEIGALRRELEEVKLILKRLSETNEAKNRKSHSPLKPYSDKDTSRRVVESNRMEQVISAPISIGTQNSPPTPAVRVADKCVKSTASTVCEREICDDSYNQLIPRQTHGRDCRETSKTTQPLAIELFSDKVKKTEINDNDKGWKTVQNKKRSRHFIVNRRGKAEPLDQYNFRAADRTASLYVSRVHVETRSEDIAGFIKHKTDLDVNVTKINTFENEFNAFKIVVPIRNIDIFLNDNGDQFWPADIVFRRYLESRKGLQHPQSLKKYRSSTNSN